VVAGRPYCKQQGGTSANPIARFHRVRIGVRAFEVPASEAHELVFGEPIPESPR